LVDRFLTGDVRSDYRRCDRRSRLEQQGRFTDPRVAADEYRGAGHEAAAADAVEFSNTGLPARRQQARSGQADKAEGTPIPATLANSSLGKPARRFLTRQFLDQ